MTRQIPMLFSPAMIEALLAGRKTETRRVLKPQPDYVFKSVVDGSPASIQRIIGEDAFGREVRVSIKPACEAGDLIWVKENYRIGAWRTEQWARGNGECDADVAVDYMADNHARKEWLNSGDPEMMLRLVEQSRADAKADGRFQQDAEFEYRWSPGESPCRKRPSIHMPKAFSRLTLCVTSYGIERLHDIDEAGAVAEGIERLHGGDYDDDDVYENYSGGHDFGGSRGAVYSYRTLWNSINGPDAWAQNPWVSVTKFEVIRQNVIEVAQ